MMQVQFAPLSTLDGTQLKPDPAPAPTEPKLPAPETPPPPPPADEEAEGIASFVRFSDTMRAEIPEAA